KDMGAKIEEIGKLIRKERNNLGLTQDELGQKVGVGKAQISKIENGQGSRISTLKKVLDTLNLTATVELNAAATGINKKLIEYVVANISEFAKKYDLTIREASNYLNLHKGLSFLEQHYDAEHLLSIDDSVEDLARVCYNNGGGLR
ncbi:protein containing Helix-turn-helix type 3 domain protein, partial [human gut metagenome]